MFPHNRKNKNSDSDSLLTAYIWKCVILEMFILYIQKRAIDQQESERRAAGNEKLCVSTETMTYSLRTMLC